MGAGVVVATLVAFLAPQAVLTVMPVSLVPILLGLVMFGMGLTLKPADLLPVVIRPKAVSIGIASQLCLMPLLAVVLVKVLRLPDDLALGVILVGCCPGGTASNVIAYLAKGDVALSVAMTSVSTLLAPVATPLLVKLCAGHVLSVDAPAMALSVVKVIILPIALGVLANRFLPRAVARVRGGLPFISSAVVILIGATVVAANELRLREAWGVVLVAVLLHNLLGMASGWGLARLCRLDAAKCRTLAIEVGMQNSGLAVALASLHFATNPLATVPGAIFSVWHNISGSFYASFFRRERLTD